MLSKWREESVERPSKKVDGEVDTCTKVQGEICDLCLCCSSHTPIISIFFFFLQTMTYF